MWQDATLGKMHDCAVQLGAADGEVLAPEVAGAILPGCISTQQSSMFSPAAGQVEAPSGRTGLQQQ